MKIMRPEQGRKAGREPIGDENERQAVARKLASSRGPRGWRGMVRFGDNSDLPVTGTL